MNGRLGCEDDSGGTGSWPRGKQPTATLRACTDTFSSLRDKPGHSIYRRGSRVLPLDSHNLWGCRGVVPEGDLGIRRKEGNSRENPVARRFGMMVGPFLGELDGSRELGLPKAPGSRPAPRSRAPNSGPWLLFASARGLSGPQGAPAWAQHGGGMILQPNLPSPCLLITRICMNSTHSHAHRGQRAQV